MGNHIPGTRAIPVFNGTIRSGANNESTPTIHAVIGGKRPGVDDDRLVLAREQRRAVRKSTHDLRCDLIGRRASRTKTGRRNSSCDTVVGVVALGHSPVVLLQSTDTVVLERAQGQVTVGDLLELSARIDLSLSRAAPSCTIEESFPLV